MLNKWSYSSLLLLSGNADEGKETFQSWVRGMERGRDGDEDIGQGRSQGLREGRGDPWVNPKAQACGGLPSVLGREGKRCRDR